MLGHHRPARRRVPAVAVQPGPAAVRAQERRGERQHLQHVAGTAQRHPGHQGLRHRKAGNGALQQGKRPDHQYQLPPVLRVRAVVSGDGTHRCDRHRAGDLVWRPRGYPRRHDAGHVLRLHGRACHAVYALQESERREHERAERPCRGRARVRHPRRSCPQDRTRRHAAAGRAFPRADLP